MEDTGIKRTFDTGATRDTGQDKLEYAGFLSPTVLRRFAEYMHKNRFLRDGSMRASDNWQKGIPLSVYEQSLWRHFMDFWALYRGHPECAEEKDMQTVLCALMFNVMGFLHETLKTTALWDSILRTEVTPDLGGEPLEEGISPCGRVDGHSAHIYERMQGIWARCGGVPQPGVSYRSVDRTPTNPQGVDVKDTAAPASLQNPHTLIWQSDINRG